MIETECTQCGMRDWSPSCDSVLIQKWLRCNIITREKDGCGGVMQIREEEDETIS